MRLLKHDRKLRTKRINLGVISRVTEMFTINDNFILWNYKIGSIFMFLFGLLFIIMMCVVGFNYQIQGWS